MDHYDYVTNFDTGIFSFTTATGSTYTLDMDARTLAREPDYDQSVPLRKDREPIPVDTVLDLSIGHSGHFILSIVDGMATLRTTSLVMSIKEIR